MTQSNNKIEYTYGLIYKIKNQINNRIYIGQTRSHYGTGKTRKKTGIEHRWKNHQKSAKKSETQNIKKQCRVLNNAIKKYGIDNFIIEKIHQCSLDKTDYWEDFYIKKFNSLVPNGYNMREGGMTGSPCEELKIHFSKKTKEYYMKKENKLKQSSIISKIQLKNMILELYASDIKHIEIKPIKENGIPKIIYMYVQLKNNKERKRYRFGGKHIDFQKSLKKALKIANFVADKNIISVSPEITDTNNPLVKYQSQINKFKQLKITRIRIIPIDYKQFVAVRTFMLPKKGMFYKDEFTMCFGGKTINTKDAFNIAYKVMQQISTTKTDWVISEKFDAWRDLQIAGKP